MQPTQPTTPTRRVAAVRVELVRERGVPYPGGALMGSPADLARIGQAVIGGSDREMFVVVHVSAKHRVNAVEITAVGTLSATLVTARETFKGALLANAAAVGLLHQHPSGDPTPSPEDLELTRQLLAAGELLGIRVLDHVVLGDERHVSIREATGLWGEFPFHR